MQQLAAAADVNFITHAGWVQRHLAGMTVSEWRGLTVIDSGLPCDTFNFVSAARLTTAEARTHAREVLSYFENVQRPFSWWVGPADLPMDLGSILLEIGLERAETEIAMAADLTALPQETPRPRGLHIERVRTHAALADFALINAANWSPPDPMVLRFYQQAEAVLLERDCPLWLYVGYLNDLPVATAELVVGGGVVGLYNVSTRETHRRRGFGGRLTLQPLLDARPLGHHTAILQAAPEGVSIYQRMGFRRYGDITEYKPPEEFAATVNPTSA